MPKRKGFRRGVFVRSPSTERIRNEVDEELLHHIDRRAAALEHSGLTAAEARAQALREFGDLADAARYCVAMDQSAERRRRAGSWWRGVRDDVRYALRLFWRAPAFAAATVLTLALAASASVAVFSVLYSYLIRPLPFPAADRLVWVAPPSADRSIRAPSLENIDWSLAATVFEAEARWDLDGFTITGEPYAETVTGAWVTPGFFDTFGVTPALGRGFHPDEYRNHAAVALISHELWVSRFGADPGIVGSEIGVYSTERSTLSQVTVVGVTPQSFWPIHWPESAILLPLPPDEGVPTLARMLPGLSVDEAAERLDAIVRPQIAAPVDPAWRLRLVPARDRHTARVRPVLTALSAATLFMLLAACGSVTGALVSRMAERRRELAVRLALGSSRRRIVRQLQTESLVVALLAGLLGVVVAYTLLMAGGPLIERELGTSAPGGASSLRPTGSILLLSALVSAALGCLLGLIPALTFVRLGRTTALSGLLGSARAAVATAGTAPVRRVLIAGQIAVAMTLAFGAALMFQTLARMAATDFGVQVGGVLTASVTLPESRYPDSTAHRQVMERLLTRLTTTAGVRNAAAVFPLPVQSFQFPVLVEGSSPDEESAPRTGVYTASRGYFETIGIPLLAGRSFNETDDYAAPLVVVISESLARRIAPSGNALGRRLRVRVPYNASFSDNDPMPWRTVIGIVRDTRKGFTDAGSNVPDLYVPYDQNPRNWSSLVIRTQGSESAMVEPVRRAVANVDPGLALSGVQPFSQVVARLIGQRRGLAALLGLFATFALGISALALYASLSYTVAQRRSELALRMAIGASSRSILRLVAEEGLLTAAAGMIAGLAGSVAISRLLANQLYGVRPEDPRVLALIVVVLLLTVLSACVRPAWRASRTDPAAALRD